MATINPTLLEKLASKLGVGNAALYKKIQSAANKYTLPRPEAALALAADLNINAHRFGTKEQWDRVAAARRGGSTISNASPMEASGSQSIVKARKGKQPKKPKGKNNAVFLVLGRDTKVNNAMKRFLRALSLQPIEWEQACAKTGKPNPYIGEILAKGFEMAAAIVVLMTPDDEARLKQEHLQSDDEDFESKLTGQPRPNVLFEAGYALAMYPLQTVLVQVGKLRGFSDIHGTHMARIGTGQAASRKTFVGRLKSAGLTVDDSGTEWLTEGDFS